MCGCRFIHLDTGQILCLWRKAAQCVLSRLPSPSPASLPWPRLDCWLTGSWSGLTTRDFQSSWGHQACRVWKMLPGNNPLHPPPLTVLVWPPQLCSSSIGGRWFDRHWIWCLELPHYLFSTLWPIVGLCINVCPPWKDPLWWGMRAVPSYQGTAFTQQLDNKNTYVCVLHIYISHCIYVYIYIYCTHYNTDITQHMHMCIYTHIMHSIYTYTYTHTHGEN